MTTTGKLYVLTTGTFKAYQRRGRWYYVDNAGIEKRCGKHSCLRDEIEFPMQATKNASIAQEFVDSLTLHHYYGEEAPEMVWKHNDRIDYLRTWSHIMKYWEHTGYVDVFVEDDLWQKGYLACGVRHPPSVISLTEEEQDAYWEAMYDRFESMKKHLIVFVRFKRSP